MDPIQFGKFIQSQRKALGLTQAQLAQILHVTDKAVSRWERGVGFPELTLLEPLSDALEVSLLELMQSRKTVADTVSTAEAGAAVASALKIAQKEQGDIRKTGLWWAFYLPVCAILAFFLWMLNLHVETDWVRAVGTYLVISCGSLSMQAVSVLLEVKRNPSRPVFSQPMGEYVTSGLFGIGGLLLILSLTLPDFPGILRFAGCAMLAVYPLYRLLRRKM